MTLSPTDAKLVLSLLGHGESAIRPGEHTALQVLDLLSALKQTAKREGER